MHAREKRWEIWCIVIITIIIFKRSGNGFTIYRCKNRFTISTLFVVRSRIASLISHVILPDRHAQSGGVVRASSYLYAYLQGLGFGLFSSLYCCQMGPAVNLNGLSIIYIKYTYDYVPYIHTGVAEARKKYGNTR